MITQHVSGARRKRRSRLLIAPIVVLAAIALVACSGAKTEVSPASSGPVDPFHPELTTMTGVMFQQPNAAQFYGAEQPAREQYGLTLKREWETDGGVGLQQLVAGDVDVMQTSASRIADASRQGIGMKIVAAEYLSTPDFSTLETLPNSGIKSLADLKGKKVGLTSTVGLYATRAAYAIKQAGVDPKDVTFIVVPYGSAVAALQKGTVDATVSQGNVTPQLRKMGSKSIFDFGAGRLEGRVENVWAITAKFYQANPNTVAAFQCAILQGGTRANTPEVAHEYFIKVLDYSQELAKSTTIVPSGTGPITAKSIQADYDESVEVGVQSQPFDMSTAILRQPTNCTK